MPISRIWGQYSPYFPVPSENDPAVPAGCTITFAQVLSRHGARDPTTKKTLIYNDTIAKIHATVTDYSEEYKFIRDFDYTLGADQLTDFGRRQMIEQGQAVAERYGHLADEIEPFIRASGQERVIESAEKWAEGFYGALGRADEGYLGDISLVPETDGFNNTLDHGRCTVFEEGPLTSMGDDARNEWADIFTIPIIKRLEANLVGAKLSRDDAIYLMDMCPFVTVAHPQAELSDFCHLFSVDEWRSYDYYQTLGKYYGYSNGNPLGPTQGVGFVNELIARLMRQPVDDRTSTNSTLTGSPATFPLDRALYADFSHDNTMVSIYSALGLYNATAPLPKRERVSPEGAKGFAMSWMVPFAGRLFLEKMTCGRDERELVRVLVNDRVVPLQGCGADELGRCELGEFVGALSFARGGGHWDRCFMSV